MRILLPLVAPGLVATSVFAFITTWNEYIFARVLLNDQSKQTVTVWLSYFLGTSRNTDWGALMAASTLTAIPVVDLLPARPAADRVRADRRGRARMSELERLAAACIFPSFPGDAAPDWVLRFLAGGLGGIVPLRLQRPRSREQLAALCAALRAERPDLLLAIDEEGGDVTRLEWDAGSSYPGNAALGVVDDSALTERVAAAIAADLAAVGVNLDLAPVADVNVTRRTP